MISWFGAGYLFLYLLISITLKIGSILKRAADAMQQSAAVIYLEADLDKPAADICRRKEVQEEKAMICSVRRGGRDPANSSRTTAFGCIFRSTSTRSATHTRFMRIQLILPTPKHLRQLLKRIHDNIHIPALRARLNTLTHTLPVLRWAAHVDCTQAMRCGGTQVEDVCGDHRDFCRRDREVMRSAEVCLRVPVSEE